CVEADLERLATESPGVLLLPLAPVLGSRRSRQLACGEAQPERGVALGHYGDPAYDLEHLVAWQRHLVFEALRDQLLVVRKLPVDPARGEPDAVDAEHDLVLVYAELDLFCALPDTRQFRERPRRDDRLELRNRPLEH